MDSHLVTVEVSVVCCTYERMKLNCTAFNKYRLECLDTKSMKCRCTVKHNRMLLDNVFKDVPDLCLESFNHSLCRLNIVCKSLFNKLLHNEGLEKLDSHFLRKTALENLKLRAYNDNRTSRIVNKFTEKVLTETSLFTLKHIGK